MIFYTYESFLEDCFGNYKKPTYEQFRDECRLVYTQDKVLLKDFVKKLDDDDPRKKDYETWSHTMYKNYIEDFEVMMKKWFDKHISVDDESRYFRYSVEPTKYTIEDGFIIDGRKEITRGRAVRNINYKGVYKNTSKSNTSEKVSPLDLFEGLLYNEIRATTLIVPVTYKFLETHNYDSFFAMIRGTCNKASIFNPYTYSWILKNVFPEGKNLFSPVLSWNTPIIGLANSNYKNMVAVDVIPEVVSNAEALHDYSESMRNPFFDDDTKSATFYCCPSEKLDERHNFSEKYKDYFDLVFFSPPYYDLEMYSGGEQSYESFTTYQEWLDGYWRPTVELCSKVLKPGAPFSFVIVEDYPGKDKKRIPISEDMKRIACEYFEYDKKIHIAWGGFATAEKSAEKRKNLLEDVHILKKV
jgi:hypothetical protein